MKNIMFLAYTILQTFCGYKLCYTRCWLQASTAK